MAQNFHGQALADASHPDRFGVRRDALAVEDDWPDDTRARPPCFPFASSHAAPESGVPMPEVPYRIARFNLNYTVRLGFGHWLADRFTGAHVAVLRPQYTTPNGVQNPLDQQRPTDRVPTWDNSSLARPA